MTLRYFNFDVRFKPQWCPVPDLLQITNSKGDRKI